MALVEQKWLRMQTLSDFVDSISVIESHLPADRVPDSSLRVVSGYSCCKAPPSPWPGRLQGISIRQVQITAWRREEGRICNLISWNCRPTGTWEVRLVSITYRLKLLHGNILATEFERIDRVRRCRDDILPWHVMHVVCHMNVTVAVEGHRRLGVIGVVECSGLERPLAPFPHSVRATLAQPDSCRQKADGLSCRIVFDLSEHDIAVADSQRCRSRGHIAGRRHIRNFEQAFYFGGRGFSALGDTK